MKLKYTTNKKLINFFIIFSLISSSIFSNKNYAKNKNLQSKKVSDSSSTYSSSDAVDLN